MVESLLTLVGSEQSDTGIDDQAINGTELLLGVQFPSGYRRIALAFDGAIGCAVPNSVEGSDKEYHVSSPLTLSKKT